jgi:vacuolar-type H+-ATPase subunit E/Vma4
MKQEASFFEDRDATLIYIAKKLKDAMRLESVLTEAGVDYGVEADEYRGGVVFTSARIGAFFYVLPEALAAARETMGQHGFKLYQEPVPGK